MTVKKGVNDHEIGKIIDHALTFKCVRGITFQPIQDTGRNEGFNKNTDRFLLSDIRRAIYQPSSKFTAEDIIPLPCNPESIAIGYALRSGRNITPITSMFPKEGQIIPFDTYNLLYRDGLVDEMRERTRQGGR